MLYKRKFQFHNFLSLNLTTNSRIILNKVANQLGEIKSGNVSNRNIDFLVLLKTTDKSGSKKTLNQGISPSANIHQTTITNLPLATVKADPYLNVVKADIFSLKVFKDSLVEFTIFQPLRFILAISKIFFLHASFVSKNGKTILFSGPQNCGKSVLSLSLVLKRKFNLLTDDKCFLKLTPKNAQVYPIPTSIGVKKSTLNEFPELKKIIIPNFKFGGKKRLFLNTPPDNTKNINYCDFLIFPRYKEEGTVTLKRIPAPIAFKKLSDAHITKFQNDRNDKLLTKYFWTLYALANNTPCFELTYNDRGLNKACDIIEELIWTK